MIPFLQKNELDTLALTDSVHQAAAAVRPWFRVRAFDSEQVWWYQTDCATQRTAAACRSGPLRTWQQTPHSLQDP